MKIYLVLYHDKWEHCECDEGCCCAITTEVKAVKTTQLLAEQAIQDLMKRTFHDQDEFEIIEMELS